MGRIGQAEDGGGSVEKEGSKNETLSNLRVDSATRLFAGADVS